MTNSAPLDDNLSDFVQREFSFNDETKLVYSIGTGPAVIVMTEFPGITPDVARFARWIRNAGFTVLMPSLFGRDGAAPTAELAGETMRSVCVRREFSAFAAGEPSPMVGWLRNLAAQAHIACGGRGVGAVGMCFTANFALAMMLEPSMLTPRHAKSTLFTPFWSMMTRSSSTSVASGLLSDTTTRAIRQRDHLYAGVGGNREQRGDGEKKNPFHKCLDGIEADLLPW